MTAENEYTLCELVPADYDSGYLELMQEFSNYKKDVSREAFEQYVANSVDRRIMVLRNTDHKIIGAGTIFKIEKLHNNAIGQIEDVMISEQYRGKGLGKLIVRHLTQIGLDDFLCYKVILNCLEKNIGFYDKCEFETTGVQMKWVVK
jgi:glucosamine-phosphate N-acetyltransferase